jgi:hypothetical protein
MTGIALHAPRVECIHEARSAFSSRARKSQNRRHGHLARDLSASAFEFAGAFHVGQNMHGL